MSGGTVGVSGVGFQPVGGGTDTRYRPGIDQTYLTIETQSIVPMEVPNTASMEMSDRDHETELAQFALYDLAVPARPEVTMRDERLDPTYYYSPQSAQVAPVLVDVAGSLPDPSAAQPLGMGGIPSPGEAMMLASLMGIVGVSG